eukprot:Gb_29845 [translate_table: standard]
MLDSLFGRGSASKCKSLIKPIKCRVDFLRKKRTSKVNMLRKDVAELLAKGQDQSAFSRVELLFTEQNLLAGYDMIELFCDSIQKRLSYIQKHKDCPQDIKEAVSSLIFAAARCADLPELQGLRSIFATRYGDDFANAAIELLPDCGVNQQIIEKLLARPPSSDVKLKLMKEIAEQTDCRWESSNLEAKIHSLPENSPVLASESGVHSQYLIALLLFDAVLEYIFYLSIFSEWLCMQDGAQDLRSFKSFQNRTDSSHHLPSHKPFVDSTPMHSVNNGGSLHSTSSSAVKKKEAAISYEMKESVLRPVGCEEDIYNRDIPVVSSSVKEIPIIPGDSDKRVEKLNSLPGSRSKYLKNSSSDPFVQANLKFTDMEASADRATADQADEATYLAADHEKSLNKLQTKTEVVNCQFDTRPESQEEDPRQSNDKPWTSKISRGTSAAEIKDHEIKYSNGNANTLFLEESNGIPWRDSVPAAQHMSDMAYRMSTRRASHLTVDKEEFGEFSERADNRKFQEHYDNRRQRSIRTCDEVSKLEANGVQADSHGKHYRPPRTYRQDVEDHEPRRFNRPDGRGDATAEKECESEFQDSSTNGRKFKAKSKRFHSGSSHYAVEKNNFYFADNAGKFIAANRVDQNVFEPSIKESTGRKLYSDQVLESEEGYVLKSSSNNPDKKNPTQHYSEDRISNGMHNGHHRSHERLDCCDHLDSGDAAFIKVENMYAERDGPSPVQERISKRESSRRVYYVNDKGTFDDARHPTRKGSDKGSNAVKLRSYKMTYDLQKSEPEENHETYYFDQEGFYGNNDSKSFSFGRLPNESQQQHRKKGTNSSKLNFRANYRLHSPGDSSPTNNLNPNDDHGSDLEEQNLQQSYHTKRCTNLTYLQTAESVRRPYECGQTRETKLQQESNNSVDSPHTHIYHVDQNNSDLEDHYFQECVSKGLRAKGTPLAGAKFERKQSDSRLTGESKSLSRRINSLQHKEGYPLNKEQLASSLDVQGEKFSWKNRRDERVLSESKQKVYTSMDSQVGIVEAGNVQHSDHHQFLNGKHRIPEATECSPAEGRRHNIQHAKSYRGRDVENASHQVQSHDPSECLHSTSVKKLSKSRMPPSIEVVRKNSYTLPSDSTINSPLPPPSRPPISPTPAQASVSPECISQAGHYYKQAMPATGSSPQRLSPEHHRAVSLPPERSTKREKSPQFSKSSSDVGPSHTPHVHPKLPDYDDLAARFQALRQQRTTK